MDILSSIIIAAVLVEGLITYIKTIVVNKVIQWQTVTAIIIGVAVGLLYNLDLFAFFGLVSVIPYAGSVLTGIVISRGSNYIFDIIKLIRTLIEQVKTSI